MEVEVTKYGIAIRQVRIGYWVRTTNLLTGDTTPWEWMGPWKPTQFPKVFQGRRLVEPTPPSPTGDKEVR